MKTLFALLFGAAFASVPMAKALVPATGAGQRP
jgi:cytochrome c oxidase assembly protein Cox11